MSPIVFRDSTAQEDFITEKDCDLYLRLMTCDNSLGHKIYQTAYDYFKYLWTIDEICSETNLDTLEKFLPTIRIKAVYIGCSKDESANITASVFRPAWDEEHGMAVSLNLHTMEVKLYE